MPLGDKTGMDWGRAVYADPANREGFRRSVLRSELRASPGCGLEGAVTGVAEIGNLGMIGTAIRAACAQNVTLSGEFYSGYDGACQYQVQLILGAGQRRALAAGARDHAKAPVVGSRRSLTAHQVMRTPAVRAWALSWPEMPPS
jgi:hypothetical protein